jgi:hypothetical protein
MALILTQRDGLEECVAAKQARAGLRRRAKAARRQVRRGCLVSPGHRDVQTAAR